MSDSVYPTTLDTFIDPLGTDQVSVVDHALNHRKANDAALALETKVGINGSLVITTIDYLLKNSASVDPGHHHSNTSIDSLAVSKLTGGQALTNVNDTNVTLSLGGAPSTALLGAVSLTLGWTGTLAAGRLNSSVVQAVTNDTNITGSIAAQVLTLGFTGTLAAGRLNANVVQAITNDTNVTGSISAQNLTLAWSGILSIARGGTALSATPTDGQLLIGKTSTNAYVQATLTAGTGISITNGSGAITVAVTGSVPTSVVNDTNVTGSIAANALTLGWTGTLAISRGGTNASTASTAFNNLSPMTTLGDLIYGGTAGAGTRLAGNTTATKNFLIQTGNGSVSAAPSWGTIVSGDLPSTVVTSVVNDTNVTGSIAAQALTLGWTGQLSLSRGGTNANLTASNGGIVWSDASKLQILAGNATAGLALISGASATPSWFTPTAGQVLYAGTGGILASSANYVWDNTNNRLGINVASPNNPLEISGSGELLLSTYRINMLISQNNSGGNTGFGIKNLGTAAVGTSISFVGVANRTTGGASFAGQFVWTVQDTGNTTFSTDCSIQTSVNNVLKNNLYIDKSGNIQLLNLINKYNNVTTVGMGVPAIYGQGRPANGQTGAVASVATYTPTADGSFIICANVLVTASTLHSFTVTCAYTDEGNTARTLTLNFSQITGTFVTAITNGTGVGAYEGVLVQIRAKANTAITIATVGTFTTVTYNVEAYITQLG